MRAPSLPKQVRPSTGPTSLVCSNADASITNPSKQPSKEPSSTLALLVPRGAHSLVETYAGQRVSAVHL